MKPLGAVAALLLLLQAVAFGAPAESRFVSEPRLPGVELAQSVSEITGTAISPLLGVTSVGAWRYYQTPESQRRHLPWFCHPGVWTCGFILLGICFLKDLVGTAAPSVLKKPLDFVELFENKLSAIVASSAFVPIIAAEMARATRAFGSEPLTEASLPLHHAAAVTLPALTEYGSTALAVILAVAGFLLVWLACHAINVLIALSPFTTVDAGLKLIKLGLLSIVTAGAFVTPLLGLGICFTIVVLAALIAPWTFRFTLFGTVFATDLFLARVLGRTARSGLSEPKCFTTRSFRALPTRTYGRLMRSDEGKLVFRYRPWLFLPRRNVPVPEGAVTLSKGLLCPMLLHCDAAADHRTRAMVLLLPRYCAVEGTVAEHLGIRDLRDGTILRGVKAIRLWLAEMLGFGRAAQSATAC